MPLNKDYLKNMTTRPGVYRMYDAEQVLLYVGKASNLKNRLKSYFAKTLAPKTAALMSRVEDIQMTITETETEALLLECNLIKKHLPKYNVLLRDDKSYPYIFLSADKFPRLDIVRGAKTQKGRYFGPYPNGFVAKKTLKLMQKLFPVRQCKNTYFNNRSRPCLQYQIKRCTAPCVDLISQDDYTQDVKLAELFLQGKDQTLIQKYIAMMDQSSNQQRYEQAAIYRDKVSELRRIQEQQMVSKGDDDIDVIGFYQLNHLVALQILKIRHGRMEGNDVFFPKVPKDTEAADILESFVSQYYVTSNLARDVPKQIILPQAVTNQAVVADLLSKQAGFQVKLFDSVKSERAKWQAMASVNAKVALTQRINSKEKALERLTNLQTALNLAVLPEKIECFDISHTQGIETVASCVVCENGAMNHQAYRRFNIKDIKASDDYAAMHQVLTRRYKRLKESKEELPDLLLIDGGKGQVTQAIDVLKTLGIESIIILGIAKGPSRKAGLEKLILNGETLALDPHSEALHLLQEIRDESHRFAITGHRKKRQKASHGSTLEEIDGVGAVRRRELLKQFGGLQGLKRASVKELSSVNGISTALAQKIYDVLH